jgi:hypothetical protein
MTARITNAMTIVVKPRAKNPFTGPVQVKARERGAGVRRQDGGGRETKRRDSCDRARIGAARREAVKPA